MTDSSTSSPIRILLADDHLIVRAGIRQFLEQSSDLQVIAEASNGQEACMMIEQYLPDVVVLDIQMPFMSGIDVTRWIRLQNLPVRVLVLTAYDDEPYVQAVLQAGANGYVLKTAAPQELIQSVRRVYSGDSVLDAALTEKRIFKTGKPGESEEKEPVTERELQILTLAARGLTNKAIGMELQISSRTVQNHMANIFHKLDVESRTEAVMRAVSLGLIPASIAGGT